ncbi:hypothetical protein Msil_3117 [Methylocella silvestris BL2]|uniref:Uncharacterized protein n=1 Tax=Methylocella silvestris (strain DSM 15510 / CIP 108128 / LMG 27833 / NCIMB 13906 / BL2) TaxID=395965 RepID=B8EKZ8_METSB|nr:hypothetical protein Msil_3117 [Methylocella silvestris BL2]
MIDRAQAFGTLQATIKRLSQSNAPARFEAVFGRSIALRTFALLVACCDTPKRFGARARVEVVAGRFTLPFADAGAAEAVDIFEGLLMAVAEDDVEPSERRRNKWAKRALGVLLSCLAIEEAEQDLELALLVLTGPEQQQRCRPAPTHMED